MATTTTFPSLAPIDINRISTPLSFSRQVQYFIQLWSLKIFIRLYLLFLEYINGEDAAHKPTYTKLYNSSHGVKAQVFIPKAYTSGGPALPLLIDIHGGGWAIMGPIIDAPDNAGFANTHNVVVVSISYRMAPRYPFPTAVHDVALQIRDILCDEDLPVDWSRVAVLGYSAGGNLALTAVQLHGLHDRIQAVVAYYPPVDFVVASEERSKRRTPHPDGRPDMLATNLGYFTWGYVPSGTALQDSLLSPRFASRSQLPKHVYLLGAEYDMLCNDAWTMAEELAEKEGAPKTEDRRAGDHGWECGTIRWKRVIGVEHGFNILIQPKTESEHALDKYKMEACQADVVEWLHRVAFASS